MNRAIKPGAVFVFDYPPQFVTLPEYTQHAGQSVTVKRKLTRQEADVENGPMFLIEARDGWQGHAFKSELVP